MQPGQGDDWRNHTLRILGVVLLSGAVMRLAGVNLFDGLYWLLGIEKMPWQQ